MPDAPERLRTVADLLAFENLVSPAFEQAVLLKTKQRSDAQAPPSIDKVPPQPHPPFSLPTRSLPPPAQAFTLADSDKSMHSGGAD